MHRKTDIYGLCMTIETLHMKVSGLEVRMISKCRVT